jgi:CRISPR system Cascade subunit CasE
VPDALHLVKIPLRADRLIAMARQRHLRLRDLDDGYLCHCVLREIWQELAPSPFVLRGHGPTLDVWGYTRASSTELIEHARAFADPTLLGVIADFDSMASKPMPRLSEGRCVGFRVRACPVVRLARATNGHRAGAEVDAFLARCFSVGRDVVVSREQVYVDWLIARLDRPQATGVQVRRIRVAGMKRDRFARRTQGAPRDMRRLERPEVEFVGELLVVDGERVTEWLGHGVGRHRAFGFGAVILMPPNSSSAI